MTSPPSWGSARDREKDAGGYTAGLGSLLQPTLQGNNGTFLLTFGGPRC